MNATRINNRKTSLKTAVRKKPRRLHRLGGGPKKARPVAEPAQPPAQPPAQQRKAQPVLQPPRRVDAADPHRALARVRTVRGQRVLLERDLASALGTLSARLADLAMRHADWFPETARFSLSAAEAVQQGLWYTRSQEQGAVSGALLGRAGGRRGVDRTPVDLTSFPPLPPAVYTADGLIAAAHWLSAEAARAGDPYAECADLSARFRLAWAALDPDRS